MLKRFFLFLFATFTCALCIARKAPYSVPPEKKSRITEHAIGDNNYHQFGKLTMEQNGNKYCMSFPFLQYTEAPRISDDLANDIIPKGTEIIIALDNGETVTSRTTEDTRVFWYYWYHYFHLLRKGQEINNNDPQQSNVHLTHEKIPTYLYDNSVYNLYGRNSFDLYALCWHIKFQFTEADMISLSKNRIIDAYITRNGAKIHLPIKPKQSSRIQHSASDFLR